MKEQKDRRVTGKEKLKGRNCFKKNKYLGDLQPVGSKFA